MQKGMLVCWHPSRDRCRMRMCVTAFPPLPSKPFTVMGFSTGVLWRRLLFWGVCDGACVYIGRLGLGVVGATGLALSRAAGMIGTVGADVLLSRFRFCQSTHTAILLNSVSRDKQLADNSAK